MGVETLRRKKWWVRLQFFLFFFRSGIRGCSKVGWKGTCDLTPRRGCFCISPKYKVFSTHKVTRWSIRWIFISRILMPGCLVRILSVINRDSFLQHGNRHGYNSPPKSSQDQGKACLWFLISAHQTERPNITSKFNWWSTAPRPIHVGASKSHGDITFDFTIYERVPQVWGERNGFAACLPCCWPNGGQKSSASIHSEDLNSYRGSLAHQNFSKKSVCWTHESFWQTYCWWFRNPKQSPGIYETL